MEDSQKSKSEGRVLGSASDLIWLWQQRRAFVVRELPHLQKLKRESWQQCRRWIKNGENLEP